MRCAPSRSTAVVRSLSPLLASLALAGLAVSGCGSARVSTSPQGSTPIAAASPAAHGNAAQSALSLKMLDYLAPRDGADMAVATGVMAFIQNVQARLVAGCLAKRGLPPPGEPVLSEDRFGNADFPNLPVIARTHDLGVEYHLAIPPDPMRRMSRAQRGRYTAVRLGCVRRASIAFAAANGPVAQSLQARWYDIVYEIEGSGSVVALNHAASRCSEKYGVAATSVKDLYARMSAAINPLAIRGRDTSTLEAKGAHILERCFAPTVDLMRSALVARRGGFLANNAFAVSEVVGPAEAEVTAMRRRFPAIRWQ